MCTIQIFWQMKVLQQERMHLPHFFKEGIIEGLLMTLTDVSSIQASSELPKAPTADPLPPTLFRLNTLIV